MGNDECRRDELAGSMNRSVLPPGQRPLPDDLVLHIGRKKWATNHWRIVNEMSNFVGKKAADRHGRRKVKSGFHKISSSWNENMI